MKRVLKLAVGMLAAAGMVACGGAGSKQTGSMNVGVTSAALVNASGVLDITGPAGYKQHNVGPIPLNFHDDPVLVGAYHYTFTATGSGGAAFEAHGDFMVTAGAVTQVNILAQQTNAKGISMVAPFTKAVYFTLPPSGSAGWNVPIKLTADVTLWDNDNPDLDWFIYTWKHSCNGSEPTIMGFWLPLDVIYYDDKHMKDSAKVSTTFTSSCQGTEVITFESVNTNNLFCPDKGCSLTSTVSFSIPYDPQGFVGQALVNFAPVATCDSVSNAEPCPGGDVYLEVGASDPDYTKGGLTYSWSSACPGTSPETGYGSFSDPHALKTTFTAPKANDMQCALILMVEDALGGHNSAVVTVKTAPAGFNCPAPAP
jgi:hypothetical protein